jgi:PAS domain S-box-containing protein
MDLDWISILDNLAEMVWIMTPEGHGIWVNKQYVRYFGGTYEEMVTQSKGWELVHPDDLPRTVEAVTEWQKHNLEKELHYRLKRHDGVYLWHLARCTLIKHDNSNTVKYLIGTITNIHDQKLAEEKAKLLDEQLKTVMEHAPVMVYAIDMNGTFTLYTGRVIELTGHPASWFIGKNIYDMLVDSPRITACVRRALGGESCELKEEKWTGRYYDIFYSPSRDGKGAINGMVAIAVDITSRKLVDELAVKEKAAQETVKLRSAFLANVSHELRTPLNAVLGLAELLMHITTPVLTDEQFNYVESMHSSALGLLSIINQILDFSRIDAGRIDLERIPFNIRALIRDQLKIMKPIAMHKNMAALELKFDVDTSVPETFEGDPTRIGQIILNLLSNAVKFTERGSITVAINKGTNPPKALTDESRDTGLQLIRFSVIDTGIGISKESLQTLFQPFTQATTRTKRKYGGTGLGLSICHKLVEAMSGLIGVESEEQKGSTFWFELPLKECASDLVSADYASNSDTTIVPEVTRQSFEPSSVQGNILIAEDHPINQMLLAALLRKQGHKVTAVENGEVAVNEFSKSNCVAGATPYDLILMDCQMPEMDGYQATRAIRAIESKHNTSTASDLVSVPPRAKAHIPIIAITANAIETNQPMCIEAGMDDFVTKPITLRQVSAIVTKWLVKEHNNPP